MKSLSLYIHIPFCSNKCSYCDFYSRPPENRREFRIFIRKLLEEFDSALSVFEPEEIPTIYIGGGTPSLIPPDIFDYLLKEIASRLPGKPSEWTCEANPESLTLEHLEIFNKYGINRLSIGIQSFNKNELSTLGRSSSEEDIYRCLELIGKYWKGSWNSDLICEVPGQTVENGLKDIKKLTSYKPSHISLYTLTLEPGTPLAEQYISKMNSAPLEESLSEVWLCARDFLEKSGWNRYEISNYSLEGEECRHNIVYWEMKPFLGIGPSASSTLSGIEGPFRLTNRPSLKKYLSYDFTAGGKLRFMGKQNIIGYKDFFLENIMMGFRLTWGIDENRIRKVFGRSLENILPRWTEKYISEGMLCKNGKYWRLNDDASLFLNRIIIDAFIELEDNESDHFSGNKLDWP